MESMTIGAYLKSSWLTLLLGVCGGFLSAFVLIVGGATASLALLIAGITVGCTLLAVALDYRRKRRFFGDLAACARGMRHPLWITEMLDEPDYLEGALTYHALKTIAKAANDDVAESRRQVADYRDYVETWVHESKSPLAAARLILDNMAQGVPADEAGELMLTKVDALDEELDRVDGYIEQALFFARSESLDRDYLIRSYVLADLVGAALKANARLLIGSHVAPRRRDLDFTVFTDEKWMLFILGQLIQNSVKYAASNQAEIVFSAHLEDEGLAAERVELTVSDNGRGASEADMPRVFDRGFTGQNGRTGKRSTGIGLYLVKRLCDKMGLTVRAASREGAGFEVTIGFPTNKMHYFE